MSEAARDDLLRGTLFEPLADDIGKCGRVDPEWLLRISEVWVAADQVVLAQNTQCLLLRWDDTFTGWSLRRFRPPL